jgi:transcriptional regulator with GAF, ATPase, and Fis domain
LAVTHDAVLLLDISEDRVVAANVRAARMLGAEPAALAGLPLAELHPLDHAALLAFARGVIASGAGFTRDLTCVTREGEVLPVELHGRMLPTGQAWASWWMVAHVRPVEERERERSVAARLRESAAQLAVLAAINRGIARASDEDAAFVTLAQALGQLVAFDELIVATPEARSEASAVRVFGPAGDKLAELTRLGAATSLLAQAATLVQPLVLMDALQLQAAAGDDRELLARDGQSALVVPVRGRDGPLGALVLSSRRPRAFDTTDARTVERSGATFAGALANARVLAERHALRQRVGAENEYLRSELRDAGPIAGIVGTSPAIARVREAIAQVAGTPATVLITGETGTGKELVARAIHLASERRAAALVRVNCGAIAPGLVESELFGHARGAFTGAIRERAGRFEVAAGGTLFLDEIAELPPAAQAKLLRALQEGELQRVGDERVRKVDVRVIAATHRDLAVEVQAGRFRQDLYFRLSVFPIHVPPLRERPDDVAVLARTFLAREAAALRRPLRLSEGSVARLRAYPWPGNVRELQNVIGRAAVLASSTVLEVDPQMPGTGAAALADAAAAEEAAFAGTLDDAERRYFTGLLAVAPTIAGPAGAAARAGLHPNTLRSRLVRLGIGRGRES